MSIRIGVDSLGEVKIPGDALYGPQTQRAVENFPISGLRLPRAFIRAQGLIKASAAYSNMVNGQLDEKKARAIIQAAEEVIEGKWDDQFVVDAFQAGAGTSQNMNANEVIANRATQLLGGQIDQGLIHPNDEVNMAQSTNDTIHVAINIAGAELVHHKLLPALDKTVQVLWSKAEQFMGIIKAGRTHLQDAVPIRMGQEFSGYAQSFENAAERIRQSASRLYEIGLGGNAVGTGINAHPQYAERAIQEIARRTGLPFVQPRNRFAFMQNTSAALEVHSALKELAVHVIKVTSDLRLLSSGPRTGLAEVRLPAVQPGSSIMPGKVNPVMLEMSYMVAAQVIGNDATMTVTGCGSQLEINVMMPVIGYNLLQSLTILSQMLEMLREKCLVGLEANEAQCAAWMESSLSLVTALNPLIGYDKAAALAKQAFAEDKTLVRVIQEAGLWSKEIEEALRPEQMV
ncbi:class II fumarate hydratase [Brevibacillus ruminantium]|uniref:Class II fumarate hydratase n=1 Tax=Brevibacillus ruminantium TaxID=2950604 RepID=A0ABY4WIM6_9BACL|nr:class II fumarate hydratase [Brevibacillus ruminantium]USG64496.1 class II fumarate hydratase [Brevibacillus ruminantium]